MHEQKVYTYLIWIDHRVQEVFMELLYPQHACAM